MLPYQQTSYIRTAKLEGTQVEMPPFFAVLLTFWWAITYGVCPWGTESQVSFQRAQIQGAFRTCTISKLCRRTVRTWILISLEVDRPVSCCSFHSALSKLIFILFAKAVACWEEIPTPFLVHLPDIGFLTRVLCFIFINQIHQKEQVVGQVVLL